jgi:hypothetical protein
MANDRTAIPLVTTTEAARMRDSTCRDLIRGSIVTVFGNYSSTVHKFCPLVFGAFSLVQVNGTSPCKEATRKASVDMCSHN